MKLLFLVVVASLALPAVIDAMLDDEFFQQPVDSLFGVADGRMRISEALPPYKHNARSLITVKNRNTTRWDKFYMNNWTPVDPPGGLVLSNDQFHVDMKITSRNQICKWLAPPYREGSRG